MSAIKPIPELAAKVCQTLRGMRIDQAVAKCFLEAMQPAQIEIAHAALGAA
jgi:hypothetical protein